MIWNVLLGDTCELVQAWLEMVTTMVLMVVLHMYTQLFLVHCPWNEHSEQFTLWKHGTHV